MFFSLPLLSSTIVTLFYHRRSLLYRYSILLSLPSSAFATFFYHLSVSLPLKLGHKRLDQHFLNSSRTTIWPQIYKVCGDSYQTPVCQQENSLNPVTLCISQRQIDVKKTKKDKVNRTFLSRYAYQWSFPGETTKFNSSMAANKLTISNPSNTRVTP